jgi:hypothetical protein
MSPRKSKAPVDSAAQSPDAPVQQLAPARLAEAKATLPKSPVVKPIPDDGDFVRGSKWTPVRQTNAYDGSCWLYSPARIEFLAEASDALVSVAALMDLPDKTITKVEVILQKSTKRLFFRPATAETEETEAYFDVVQTSNDYLSINIRPLLQSNGLEVKTGYQERYPVTLDGDSPIGPALVVDLTKLEERRQTAKQKAKRAAKAAAKDDEVSPSAKTRRVKATARNKGVATKEDEEKALSGGATVTKATTAVALRSTAEKASAMPVDDEREDEEFDEE